MVNGFSPLSPAPRGDRDRCVLDAGSWGEPLRGLGAEPRCADAFPVIYVANARPLRLVGPAPCPVERIKTRWRWHFLLKSEHPAELTRVSRYFLERLPVPKQFGLRVTIDRDPVALL